MKEYEELLGSLRKENFNLKLRIYFLEERMGKLNGIKDKEEAIKHNIELKVRLELLQRSTVVCLQCPESKLACRWSWKS